MDSYLMMLYVTLEQESALKQFFLEHGWPYSKPDLSITTDKLGPANCNLVSSPVVLPQPASDKVEPTKSSQVPNTAPDIEPTSIKPGKRKAKPPPRYAVKEKQAKVATKQHSTRTSKQKDTMTYIDIDTAGPSNVFADPSNISAEPSDISADPSNTSSGPSNSDAGPSNIVAGPSKTAAKTVKILSITGLDGEETQVKIEVPDAEYEKESVDQDFDDNDIAYDDDDDDDPDYDENDDDDGDDSDDDYSYKGQGQSVTSNTVKNSKSGADDTTSASKEQSVGTENSKKETTMASAKQKKLAVSVIDYDKLNKRLKHACEMCNYRTNSKSNLNRHFRVHKNKPGWPSSEMTLDLLICEHCGKEFKTKYGLSLHRLNHEQKFRYTCTVCQRGFNQTVQFRFHCAQHEKVMFVKCSFCEKKFQGHSSLQRHLRMCTSNPEANLDEADKFVCDLCCKVFTTKDSLKSHKDGKHGAPRHTCLNCGKAFGWRSSLKVHKALCKW